MGAVVPDVLPERPTAVAWGSAVQAVSVLLKAQASGIEVPGDLFVTSFSGRDIACKIPPGLTTVHTPAEAMGRQAADLLCAEATAEETPAKVELPAEFVVRGLTGGRLAQTGTVN